MGDLPIPAPALEVLGNTLIGAAFLVAMGLVVWLIIRSDKREKEFDEAMAVKDAKIAELYEQNRSDATLLRDKLEHGLDKLAQASEVQREFLTALSNKRAGARS